MLAKLESGNEAVSFAVAVVAVVVVVGAVESRFRARFSRSLCDPRHSAQNSIIHQQVPRARVLSAIVIVNERKNHRQIDAMSGLVD
jgi:hypothetical protein